MNQKKQLKILVSFILVTIALGMAIAPAAAYSTTKYANSYWYDSLASDSNAWGTQTHSSPLDFRLETWYYLWFRGEAWAVWDSVRQPWGSGGFYVDVGPAVLRAEWKIAGEVGSGDIDSLCFTYELYYTDGGKENIELSANGIKLYDTGTKWTSETTITHRFTGYTTKTSKLHYVKCTIFAMGTTDFNDGANHIALQWIRLSST